MSSKLPIVKVKILEKLFFYLGFEMKRQKGVMYFTGIRMEGSLRCLIMEIRK